MPHWELLNRRNTAAVAGGGGGGASIEAEQTPPPAPPPPIFYARPLNFRKNKIYLYYKKKPNKLHIMYLFNNKHFGNNFSGSSVSFSAPILGLTNGANFGPFVAEIWWNIFWHNYLLY